MSQSNRSSPNHSPFPLQKGPLPKATKNPAKFFTIHAFQNPQAKPSSILLTEENVSIEQESTYPSTSLKSSRESFSNAKTAFSPDRNMQNMQNMQNVNKLPMLAFRDSIYQLPSQKITPIVSLSELDPDDDLDSIDIERRNLVNEINISLKTLQDKKSPSNHSKAQTCRMSPASGNITPALLKNSLPITSIKNIKGRSYGAASNVQFQYQRYAATNSDMEYYFSNNMSEKSQRSVNSLNCPTTARMSSNLLKNKDRTSLNTIVFEPPKYAVPQSFTARMKLKEYLRPPMNHSPIMIKTLDENLTTRGRDMANANKTTIAWSVKCKSSAMLPCSPVKTEGKVKKVKATSQSKISFNG